MDKMKRRSKQDLKLAKKKRQKKAESLLKQTKKSAGKKVSQNKNNDEQLFENFMGYDFGLVKKDLFRTTWVSLLVSLILIALAIMF